MTAPGQRVALAPLHGFAVAVLQRAGLPADQAARVADSLLWAEARGVDTHGVSRLPFYAGLLASGEMAGGAEPRLVRRLPAVAVLDGGGCAGAVGMAAATRHAIELAAAGGIGLALLRGTTHTGALGCHTTRIAQAGMVGLAGAASGPMMAYHQAAAAGVSTAPLSIAAPGGRPDAPIVFDMASGIVSMGRLLQARAAGEALPAGWALDAAGRPTTDAAAATTPLPLGGAKGSGLALMLEVLASLLTLAPILAPSLAQAPGERRHTQNAFVIAIDIAQVAGVADYTALAAELAAAIHALPPAAGAEVLLPGERGARAAARSAQDGVLLAPPTVAALTALAARLGVQPPWGAGAAPAV